MNHLWQAGRMGMTEMVEDMLASAPRTADDITEAFWQDCHGGQRRTAEFLLAQGADINGHPDYNDQTPAEIAGSTYTRRGVLVDWLREQGAAAPDPDAGHTVA